MEHIRTLETRDLAGSVTTGGCGECQTSPPPPSNSPWAVPTSRCETGGERRKWV